MLNTLGVAQYRVGEYEEALNTLRQSDRLNGGIPEDLAFIAMSLHQLDEKEQAEMRAKIEQDPSRPIYVKTVWGVGYKF